MLNLDDLIKKGQVITFSNNSYSNRYGVYTRASPELLGWIANVGDFIRTNYGEDSHAYKQFLDHDKRKLNGFLEDDFIKQMNILNGALDACKKSSKSTTSKKDDSQIIQLLKNPYFYSVLVVFTSVAFKLGEYLGTAKFDKEKIEITEQNRNLRDSIIRIYQNKEIVKYTTEIDFRTSQIEKFVKQNDTLSKEKWKPSLYIWRTVTGDKEYEPLVKEFKNVSMIDLVNWIKTNTLGKKLKKVDAIITILKNFEENKDSADIYDMKVMNENVNEFKLFVDELKLLTSE